MDLAKVSHDLRFSRTLRILASIQGRLEIRTCPLEAGCLDSKGCVVRGLDFTPPPLESQQKFVSIAFHENDEHLYFIIRYN
jgi:hypothetical protein